MGTKPKQNYAAPKNGTAHPKDQFQTPPYALEPLLPYLRAAGVRAVWEPAAGLGYLAVALREAGFSVAAGDITTGQDYFDDRSAPRWCDCQVTNVPFSLKYEWTARACALGMPFALLMPSDVLFAGRKMAPLIQRYDLRLLVPTQRIDFKTPMKPWAESSAQMHTSWVTYRLDLPERLTYVDLRKPSKATLRQWDAAAAATAAIRQEAA